MNNIVINKDSNEFYEIGSGHGFLRHTLSERLTRHFVPLTFFTPSDNSIRHIFSQRLQNWLELFPSYTVDHLPEFASVYIN